MKFIETNHCRSGAHCRRCRSSEKWRRMMTEAYEWDGTCPLPPHAKGQNKSFGDTKKGVENVDNKPKAPCPTKVCRMGDRECKNYRSCRDTCMINGKRLTAMEKCPEVLDE